MSQPQLIQAQRQAEWSSNCNLGNDHKVCWSLRRYFDRLPGETSPLFTKHGNNNEAMLPRSRHRRNRMVEGNCFHSDDWDQGWFLLGDDQNKHWVQRRYFDLTASELKPLLTPKSPQRRPRSAAAVVSKPSLTPSSPPMCRPKTAMAITRSDVEHEQCPEGWIDNFHLLGCDHRKMWPQRRYFDDLPSQVRPLLTPPSDSTVRNTNQDYIRASASIRQQNDPMAKPAGIQDVLLGCDHGMHRSKRRYFDDLPAESDPLLTPPNMRRPKNVLIRGQSSPALGVDSWNASFHFVGCDHGVTKLKRRYFDGLPSEAAPLLTRRQ